MSSVKDPARASSIDFLPTTVVEGRGDVGCPVVHFDFRVGRPTAAYLEIAKLLRDRGPSYFNTLAQGFWMVTSYGAVRDMFTRRDLFSSRSFDATNPDPDFQTIPTQFDAPEHLKYRRVLAPWFSARAIYARESQIRAIARRLVDEIAPSGGADVVSRFCLRLSTQVYLLLVGQPTQHADQIVAWLTAIFAGCAKKPGAAEPMKAALAALTEYHRYVLDHHRRHMRDPNTDFFTHLLTAKLDDRNLDQKELEDICHGMTTTCLDPARALRYLLIHLANHENDRRRLNADMNLVPTAIEESLRYHPLVWSDARKAIREEDFYAAN